MSWKRKPVLVLFTLILVVPLISAPIWVNIVTAPNTDITVPNTNKIYVNPPSVVNLALNPGDQFTVDICVDYVEDLWQWGFDMTFDPNVIHGVWYSETEGYPVEADPEGFLASEGGTLAIVGGPGWNNTMGKLWLTQAGLLLKLHPVTGGGVLARVTFEVVAEGESDITLGDSSKLYDLDGHFTPELEHGYFRNIDSALIPTASFTHSPLDTPESLEGYYTQFDGTGSTAPGGKTITEYRWYFWKDYHTSLQDFPDLLLRPYGDGTYTDWTHPLREGNYTEWDDKEFDSDATYVRATADGMCESSTLKDHNATKDIWPIGRVTVTMVAKTIGTPSENVTLILVVGGTIYEGVSCSLATYYKEYMYEWETNPATDSAWTWSDIDALEVGVMSVQVGPDWTGEMRVSRLYVEILSTPIVMSTDTLTWDTVPCNYTLRGTWNVTLTVIDSEDVVGTTTGYVVIKAHDVKVVAVTTDAKTGQWPEGVRYVDIGGLVAVNVTAKNEGDFPESFDVTAYYSVTIAVGVTLEEIIDTISLESPLSAGANTTLTIQWNTEGCNFTHAKECWMSANVTSVEYEYDLSDNKIERSTKVRVRFHDVAVTEIEIFPHRTLRPDGDGTFTEWTGTYADWDDWPEQNGDVDYVSAAADALNESSTLEDHTIETWSIGKIRVTIIARAITLPAEEVVVMLVIGGEPFSGSRETVTVDYAEYMYEWETNPATDSAWTWSDIDALEAGVRSEAIGGWTGEIRVTQLYVEVFGIAPGPVSRGEVVPVMVTVVNEGDFNETDISVTAYYNGDPIDTKTIPLITNSSFGRPPNFVTNNYTITLAFDWNTSGISLDEYVIRAQASLVPDEYEPDDNTLVNGAMNVTYLREASTISIAASPTSVLPGGSVAINGSITPIREGATVTILYRTTGVATWSNLTSVLTDEDGEYSYDWTATTVGSYQFRATWSGDLEYLPAESSVVTVTVGKMSSSISLVASSTSITLSQRVNFSGAITPIRAGMPVTILMKPVGQITWVNIPTTFTTDVNGHYFYEWSPAETATYEFKATWNGDANTEADESDVITVTVESEEQPDLTLPIVAVVIIVIIVAVVIFLKMRK